MGVDQKLFRNSAKSVHCILIGGIDTKDGIKLSFLFVTKEKQKVFTGPNSRPRLKNGNQFVH